MNATGPLATLADLVRINSVNPANADGSSEAGVVAYLRDYFARRGIATREQRVLPHRSNLIARLPGRNPGRQILLEAHMDTASAQGMTIPPFEPTITGGRLHGRGACDTKAGLAGMVEAVSSLADEGVTPPCEVWFAAVVDEEFAFRGVAALCEGLVADAAIVAEPTELRLIIATKGVLRWHIGVHGRAAHSSKPHLGVNAIDHMARLVLALRDLHARLAAHSHLLLGPATGSIGIIRGGTQVNVVPETCVIEVDRRLLPGERVDTVLASYQGVINTLRSRHPGFDATMEEPPLLVDEALETPADAAPVRVAGAILGELGLDSGPGGVSYGSDASKLSRQGVPSIVFGPGSIDRAHAAEEYVETDQVLQACEFYREFIRRFGA